MKKIAIVLAGALMALTPAWTAGGAASAAAPAVSSAAMARATALMGKARPGSCTAEELNALVNSCIASQCIGYANTGQWTLFNACVNSCAAQAQAQCGV